VEESGRRAEGMWGDGEKLLEVKIGCGVGGGVMIIRVRKVDGAGK